MFIFDPYFSTGQIHRAPINSFLQHFRLMRLTLVCLIIFLLHAPAFPQTAIPADPDHLSSGMFWTTEGIPCIKIGDLISFHRFRVGGMFEIRNEKRFNQELLPNHTWRGVIKFEAILYERPLASAHLSAYVNVCHESAHPTMGIREPTDQAYELIYDDVYRRMILNSAGLAGCCIKTHGRNTFSARVDYSFYYLSKNTPELTGSQLGFSHGFSLGVENRYSIGRKISLYGSLYDRLIFEGHDQGQGYVHTGNGLALANQILTYPIIAQSHTIVFKTGFSSAFGESRRKVDLFCKVLYGNPYGFIDSRDIRLSTSSGAEICQ
jgi:hypothetical protein